MYPTIHTFDTNPLHGYPSLSSGGSSGAAPSNSSPSRPPAAPQPPRANGPPAPPPTAFPTLQVSIDPRYSVGAPVRAPSQPPGAGSAAQQGGAAPPPPPGHPAPGSSQPLDLGLERRLMHDLASSSGGSSGMAVPGAQEDPYEVLLGRYIEMGFTREEVAMSLAVVGPEHSSEAERIVETCRKYKRICSMGFRSDQVAAALVMYDGDAEAAVATCLEATG